MDRGPVFDAKAFLGQGWSFPVAVDASGGIAMSAHEQDVQEAIRLILATDPGERVMRPDFGAGLRAFVFEPMDTGTLALVKHRVTDALTRWEPRIDSVAVEVHADGPRGRLDVGVRYRVRATNTFYNVVYPFYLQEGREAAGRSP